MNKRKTAAIYVLTLLLLLSIIFGERRVDSQKEYTKTLKQEYERQIEKVKADLEQSESFRQRLLKDAAVLRDDYLNLRSKDSIRSLKLKKLKGSVDKLTPSQLQKTMIDEHHKYTQGLQDRQ